jgi:hypothetical protein
LRRHSHRLHLVVLNERGRLEAAGGGLRDAFAHTADGGACRVCKRAICELKTLKTATVASTPLAIS